MKKTIQILVKKYNSTKARVVRGIAFTVLNWIRRKEEIGIPPEKTITELSKRLNIDQKLIKVWFIQTQKINKYLKELDLKIQESF